MQQIEGSNNQVAGRDYREGNTHLELNIHGDNYGPISLGGGGNGGATGGRTENHISQWPIAKLQAALTFYRAQWWSGLRGYWLNIPAFGMLALLLGIGVGLYSGVLPIRDPQSLWIVLACLLPLLMGLAFWLTRIRRIEIRVMASSQTALDEIRTELRRRR